MRRREFIGVIGAAAAWPRFATAQTQRTPIVGFTHPGFPEFGSLVIDSLREGFREAGLIEGVSVRLEARWARGKPEALPQLTRELIQLGADVLMPTARPSIEAAKAATTTIPIVANDLESDPIASGFARNMARPGANLTGVFLDAPSLCSKWLQFLAELVPDAKRIGVLWDVTTGDFQLNSIKLAAQASSLDLVVMEFRSADEIQAALDRGLIDKPHAVVQLGSPVIRQVAPRIAEVLASYRIPAISQFRSYPEGGGLISYGPDLPHLYRRVSSQVARVLAGARPADMPIERPTKFELVISVKAAKALNVRIPDSLLALADEVIE